MCFIGTKKKTLNRTNKLKNTNEKGQIMFKKPFHYFKFTNTICFYYKGWEGGVKGPHLI